MNDTTAVAMLRRSPLLEQSRRRTLAAELAVYLLMLAAAAVGLVVTAVPVVATGAWLLLTFPTAILAVSALPAWALRGVLRRRRVERHLRDLALRLDADGVELRSATGRYLLSWPHIVQIRARTIPAHIRSPHWAYTLIIDATGWPEPLRGLPRRRLRVPVEPGADLTAVAAVATAATSGRITVAVSPYGGQA